MEFMHQGGHTMIRTNSSVRPRAALLLPAIVVACLSSLWGCSETPVSAAGDETVSYCAIPMPEGHKSDMATTEGSVEAIDYTGMRLLVNGQWFYADNETDIEIDDCKPCLFSAMHIGDPAKVKYERIPAPNGACYARDIEIEHDVDDPDDFGDEAETEGVVQVINANLLFVSGLWFWMDEETEVEIDEECAGEAIILGDFVKVDYSTVMTDGLGNYAFKIEVKRYCAEEEEEEEEEEYNEVEME